MGEHTDILVAGGGIAGMMATLIFADAGFRVLCVDPMPADARPDLRSTAFLMPAVDLLARAGLFARLQPHAARLATMRIVDAGAATDRVADFDAGEAGLDQFGWNIPNMALREVLPGAIADHPRAELRNGVSVAGHTPRLRETIVRLSDGGQIRARLLIAADGRDSRLRQDAGIAATRYRYGQRATVFTVRHTLPHAGISTEVHRSGGPFTLVPLPDPNQSAVVWMERGPEVARLAGLNDADFIAEAQIRSAGVQGQLDLLGGRGNWPIIAQYAARLDAPRMALIAEAAHVVPPIGAQGLNMSLADVAGLSNLLVSAPDGDIGAPDVLAGYHRRRWPDMRLRVQGIDALNRASMARSPLVHDLRAKALGLLAGTPPLRKAAIRSGLGV